MKIFLSHAHEDASIVKLLAEFLEAATLNRGIKVWYSSDESGAGGISRGLWAQKLRKELASADLLIVLVTPNSVRAPWLNYEAGIAAAHSTEKVMPLYLGLKSSEVGSPLDQHQMYNLGSTRSFTSFVNKVLHDANFSYVPKMHDAPRNDCFAALVEAEMTLTASRSTKSASVADVLGTQLKVLSEKIDRNFGELARQLPGKRSKYHSAYDVDFTLVDAEGEQVRTFVVSMHEAMTAQELLSEVYQKIHREVDQYSYLSSWVVADPETGRKFIFREIGMLIPAEVLFEQGRPYEVQLLERPYDPSIDSEPEYLE